MKKAYQAAVAGRNKGNTPEYTWNQIRKIQFKIWEGTLLLRGGAWLIG
jgi:hypothetical protein